MTSLSDDRLLRLLDELKAAYEGFVWESYIWAEHGHRRSAYRTLVLFGLSARTRDALLVEMCREFFRCFPDAVTVAERSDVVNEEAPKIVRAGQLPFVVSMAAVVGGGVPRERDALLRIKGVGEKIAECVQAYGWGVDALPLDANCVRVLTRVFGLEKSERSPAPLREGLKCVYRNHRQEFASSAIAMVDIHEILRVHGQVCCTRTPDCSRCPVAACESRREPWEESSFALVPQGIWDDWRELIYDPAAV